MNSANSTPHVREDTLGTARENDFDEIEQELRSQAAGPLDVGGAVCEFEGRRGRHHRPIS